MGHPKTLANPLARTLARHSLVLGTAASALLLVPPALGQIEPGPGFDVTAALDLAGDRAYGTLGDGSYVSFDGLAFELYDADGSLLKTLGNLPAFVFPSFVAVHPSETFALVGESSNGDLFRVDVVNGGFTTLTSLTFNYDLAWDTQPNLAYVSAALGGFGAGNDVLRLHVDTGQTQPIAHVDGPSGPLAVDGDGNLHYVTLADGFPPPPNASELVVWTDAQLDAGPLLSEADASVLLAGLEGSSSLAHDPQSGHLFLTETSIVGGPHRVLQVAPDGELLDEVAFSPTWISNLEIQSGAGPATLAAQQPADARLFVQNTDFAGSLRERAVLEPARALATFSGPPAGQSGQATVTVQGAEPGGFVSVMLARSTEELPDEDVTWVGWNGPLFTAAHLKAYLRRTPPLPVDAAGNANFTYYQSAAHHGQFLWQAILFDGSVRPLGSSTHVINL